MISGEKKLGSIACPEPWKYGSRSAVGMYVCCYNLCCSLLWNSQGELKVICFLLILQYAGSSGRKLGENKALSSKKAKLVSEMHFTQIPVYINLS